VGDGEGYRVSGRGASPGRDVFEAPIVAEQQYDNRRHYRAERDRDQAQREIARRIADEAKDIRTEKPAEIAERVDQRDAAGGGGAGQHYRRQRSKTWAG